MSSRGPRAVVTDGAASAATDAQPGTLFALPALPEPIPPRRAAAPARRRALPPPALDLVWHCPECGADASAEGKLCDWCLQRRRIRFEAQWRIDLTLNIELGEDAFAHLWWENDGDDREAAIVSRTEPPPPGAMTAREYDAWCEAHFRAWGLIREWSGLAPELPPARLVETWFFDVPMDEFDPECDVEVHGYPARPVVEVAVGSYL